MENASKALLIAGGVLITILVLGLLLLAFQQMTEYYETQQGIRDAEDVAAFNSEFTNYNRQDVSGTDMISLINKVVDYNTRYSSAGTSGNQYPPMTLTLNMGSSASVLSYDGNLKVFTSSIYTQNNSSNVLGSIISQMTAIESDNMKNISKSINSIFLDSSATYDEKRQAIIKYNSITTGTNYKYETEDEIDSSYNEIQTTYKENAYKYYEYTSFKRGIFTSTGNIEYDQTTGRIIKMEFNFTGDIE